MKKVAILMVVLLLAIALTACTQQETVPDEGQDTGGDADTEVEETLEQQTVSEDEEVEVGNMT